MRSSYRIMTARVALATLFLALGMACGGGGRGMGEECDNPDACAGEGVCLNGVCSAYGCTRDADCDGDLVCGDVAGTQVCVLPCTADEQCLGTQTCHFVDDPPTDNPGEGACL